MRAPPDPHDPRGLIRESYRIDGITAPECRSIFFDWALSLVVNADEVTSIRVLLERYAEDAPDHPMSETLRAGLAGRGTPRRRGGPMGRRAGN